MRMPDSILRPYITAGSKLLGMGISTHTSVFKIRPTDNIRRTASECNRPDGFSASSASAITESSWTPTTGSCLRQRAQLQWITPGHHCRPGPGGATVMKNLPLSKVYQLLEPGPVVLLTTARKGRANVMTMSWHMMVEFEPPLVACVVSNAESQLCRIAGDERVRDRHSGAGTGAQSRGSRQLLRPGRG